MVFNAYHDLVEFALPETVGGSHWQLVIATKEDAVMGRFGSGRFTG